MKKTELSYRIEWKELKNRKSILQGFPIHKGFLLGANAQPTK